MGLWKSNMIIYYQIMQLSEQKYRLAIPFAENNFGPFEHVVFVIVLFESPSKTLFRVLFASLYHQIYIFYQYISISCPTVSSKWANPNRKYDRKPSKQCDVCIVWPCKCQKWIRKVKLNLHAWVWRHPGHRSFLLANYCTMYSSASKTRHLEKFKINISTRGIQTKFCTRKRLNTRSISVGFTCGNSEEFKRYSRFSGYEV
jgi:hypothetical protein